MSGRYVVLGLARARAPWFRDVGQWAHSGAVPVEFVRCVSPVELRAHLASGRAISAALLDASLPAVDRDLIAAAREVGCAVVMVDDGRVQRDWIRLGASAVLDPAFERSDLVETLTAHARDIRRGIDLAPPLVAADTSAEGALVMVCGAGGTGASTAAIALAQGLAAAPDHRPVLLADLARRADLAMLHDARDVIPSVQELVDAHRSGNPAPGALREFVFAIEDRGYDLLIGLRRAQAWQMIRPRAFATAIQSLRRQWRTIVCDTDADLEGENDGGSIDVEERNVMARTAAATADLVFPVGTPGMKGTHSLVRVIEELLDHDVPAERIVPVVNRAPRNPRSRAQHAEALARLLSRRTLVSHPANPVFLPERRVDDALRDGVPLPPALTDPLAAACRAALARTTGTRVAFEPEPVRPGSLGHWSSPLNPGPA